MAAQNELFQNENAVFSRKKSSKSFTFMNEIHVFVLGLNSWVFPCYRNKHTGVGPRVMQHGRAVSMIRHLACYGFEARNICIQLNWCSSRIHTLFNITSKG